MSYCNVGDVEQRAGGAKRLRELSDWENSGGIDPARVLLAITEADGLIDSFAGKRFSVPMFDVAAPTVSRPVRDVIRGYSAELAALILKRNRGALTDGEQMRWQEIAGTSKGAEGWLYQLAIGVVSPGGDPLPLRHNELIVDDAFDSLPLTRDASRNKTGGYW